MTIYNSPTKSIKELLNSDKSILSKLVANTKELQHLTAIFRQTVDNELSKHCAVAKFDKNKMTIIVDNANWATNLRYSMPDVIKILRTQPEFKNLVSIRYRIRQG